MVPVYNEEKRVRGALESLLEVFSSAEIIISDDGSTDGTLSIVEEYSKGSQDLVVVTGPHLGKGGALKRGFDRAEGDYIGFLDVDMSAGPLQLEKLFRIVESGDADMAIGSREVPGSLIPEKQPVHRRFLGNIYSLLARLLFGLDIRDFQCGCKVFKKNLWDSVRVNSDGFIFDTELLARANARGYRIMEIPITWANDPRSKVRAFKDPVLMFMGLFKVKSELLLNR